MFVIGFAHTESARNCTLLRVHGLTWAGKSYFATIAFVQTCIILIGVRFNVFRKSFTKPGRFRLAITGFNLKVVSYLSLEKFK